MEDREKQQEMTVKYLKTAAGLMEYNIVLDFPRIVWVPEAVSQIKAFVFQLVLDALETYGKRKEERKKKGIREKYLCSVS
jgi:hypothetical protein